MKVRNPRILFVAPLPPPVHGSAMVSQYIKDCKELQDEFTCDFVNLSTSRNIDEIGKSSLMKYIRFIGAYFITFWKLLTHRYELCYLAITCHGMGFLKDAPFVLLCKLFRRKVVIHQHNKGMSGCVDRWPYRWLLPLVYRNTRVILLSWHLYPDVERVVSREQVLICPNGIPEIPDSENVPKRNNAVPRLLFLSNLIPSKGVYVLLDACRILKDKGLRFVCNFVGGETKEINREIFEEEARKRGLDEMVAYQGPKYGKEKEICWHDADVFVQPTFEDCFPLTVIEAMQHGKPVVSTNEGAIPDMVKDSVNGFVCKRKDAVGLADATEQLITDEALRKQMGERGKELYHENFTLLHFEENFLDMLKNLNGGVKYVNYLGPQYGEGKQRCFEESDIFVLPTFYNNECFPLVLLEAMQWKLPVVSSDEGGIPDVVKDGENGFVCKRKDAESLALALEKLITNPSLRKQMGERGYTRYKEKFTLTAFEQKFIEVMKISINSK